MNKNEIYPLLEVKDIEEAKKLFLETNITIGNLSKEHYSRVIDQFIEITGLRKVQHIDPDVIFDYLFDLQNNKDYKPETIRNKITIIRSFVEFLIDCGIAKIPPGMLKRLMKTKKNKASITIRNILEPEDMEKLNRYFSTLQDSVETKRAKLLFNLGLATGLRISEMVSLKIKDITPRLEHTIIRTRTKGDKIREVIIRNELTNQIKEFLSATNRKFENPLTKEYFLFNSKKDPLGIKSHLSRQQAWRIIKRYCLLAGIDKEITPHSLRHTFATNLALEGFDVYEIKEIIGHENIQTTEIYMHLKKQIEEKIQKISAGLFFIK